MRVLWRHTCGGASACVRPKRPFKKPMLEYMYIGNSLTVKFSFTFSKSGSFVAMIA